MKHVKNEDNAKKERTEIHALCNKKTIKSNAGNAV